MIKSLPKMLAAASLSIAVALTGVMASSTRAEADNENLRRFIVGAAGIAILGSVLNNQRGHGQVYVNPQYPPAIRHVNPYYPPATRHVIQPQVQYRLVAPSNCYSRFDGPHGQVRAFGAHCMQSSAHNARLPNSCLESIFTYQGWRQVYDPQCLYRHGWSRS